MFNFFIWYISIINATNKQTETKKKPNLFFIIIVVALVAASLILASTLDTGVETVEGADLPTDETNNINELVISEIMASNGGVYVNSNNEATDYIEIYNGTGSTINLNGYGLSDRKDTIKWVFGDVSIAPGEYIVVALTGQLEEGNNASFKLSSNGGEYVILTNASGKVIDAVETVAMTKNQTMMRDGNGEWFVCNYGTPGFSNTEAGLTAYYESLKADEETAALQVNEFLARNKGNFVNEDGSYSGYIEVINVSDETINLSDYTLSNNTEVPFKYTFPDVTLASGEVYRVYTGEVTNGTQEYTGFNFDSTMGTVIIGHNGKIVQQVTYDNLTNGYALIRDEEGTYYISSNISPNYENTTSGIDQFQEEYLTMPTGLIINEIMNDNDTYLAQNGGEYYDWIEFYNNSDETINLSDYMIGKNSSTAGAYQLPDVELAPGEYYLLMCSGDSNLSNTSYLHTDFKLGDEDSLYLFKDGEIVDSLFFANIPYGYSYGRSSDYGFNYISEPTPGSSNKTGLRSVVSTPEFSVAAGVYDDVESITVELTGTGTIRYTTDGSIPTSSSKIYTGPIELTSTTVIKAKSFVNGAVNSEYVVSSYIINEYHTVPVMSVSLDESDFNSINNNPSDVGYEVQAYAEFFEEDGSFSIPCSLALFGGNARYLAKKAYALRFSSEWGASSLNYQVFENRASSSYDSLVLRTGSNDYSEAYLRDILGTSLVDDYTDVTVQAYKICVVYINGEYWGVYNLREKINASMINEQYNVDEDTVNIARIDGDVTSGSYSGYYALRRYARTHDLSNDEYYEYLAERINMVDLIDYWIAEMYTTNNDIVNCRFFQSDEYDDGKWHYIFYDLDFAFYNVSNNYYTQYLTNSSGMTNHYFENDIIKALFDNEQFCDLWLERLSYNMQNTWNTEIVLDRLDELYNTLYPEMARNQARWGLTMSQWEDAIDDLRSYIENRTSYMLSQTKSFFGLTNAEMEEYFGDLW